MLLLWLLMFSANANFTFDMNDLNTKRSKHVKTETEKETKVANEQIGTLLDAVNKQIDFSACKTAHELFFVRKGSFATDVLYTSELSKCVTEELRMPDSYSYDSLKQLLSNKLPGCELVTTDMYADGPYQ